MDKPQPDTPSSDYEAMAPHWRKVETILGGADAMRESGEAFLARMPEETTENYEFRRQTAKFTNVFGDVVANLAQRPFSKQLEIEDSAPPLIEDFVEDVDAAGNHMHVFAGETFFNAIGAGVDWILVDHTRGVGEGATVADERAAGSRPYWVRYPASSVLAVYSAQVNGREEFVHVRLLEMHLERDGYGEKTERRVRILNREPLEGGGYGPATYEVWKEEERVARDEARWTLIEGPAPITIGIIPLVPVLAGRRIGKTWRVHPPMRDAADLQIELYNQESALKHAKTLTGFPILTASGVEPARGKGGEPVALRIGPASVLYAPPTRDSGSHGSWSFIEPQSQSLRFLAEDIERTINQLRELGRQPLTAQSGNLTVITTAVAAQKGMAAIQAWALGLKDALELALDYTARWLGITGYEPNVMIDMEFDLGFGDDESFAHVLALQAGGHISREATIHEARRRNILDPDYDEEEDLDRILAEMTDEDGIDDPPPPQPDAEAA